MHTIFLTLLVILANTAYAAEVNNRPAREQDNQQNLGTLPITYNSPFTPKHPNLPPAIRDVSTTEPLMIPDSHEPKVTPAPETVPESTTPVVEPVPEDQSSTDTPAEETSPEPTN